MSKGRSFFRALQGCWECEGSCVPRLPFYPVNKQALTSASGPTSFEDEHLENGVVMIPDHKDTPFCGKVQWSQAL
jgi:hypothetical protein